MTRASAALHPAPPPRPAAVLELLKPITWFPPIWAFVCGAVSSGTPLLPQWPLLLVGLLLTGPLVCGTSQAVNDWFDRHVDAINEPDRPIPSGRVAGQWGLCIAVIGTLASALIAWATGPWIFAATLLALVLAWAYSAPPLRLKTNAILGPGAVALAYEGLTWFTGASLMLGALPPPATLAVLALYALGAHGIMTLNDFKAVEGDARTGVRSLPVLLGTRRAALVACVTMALPQLAVLALLGALGLVISAVIVAALLAAQLVFMLRLVEDPRARAPWYNATGVSAYVLGMMAAALGLGGWL